jgi:hypothetical protein
LHSWRQGCISAYDLPAGPKSLIITMAFSSRAFSFQAMTKIVPFMTGT